VYDAVVRANREQVAASTISGLAENYARGDRHTWDEAMQEIQDRLRAWKIRPERVAEVMANAATSFVDSDAWRADVALQLLVDAGANVERARAIRAAQPPPRIIGIGDAVLGGPRPPRDSVSRPPTAGERS
jgi:hypothetical protein